MFSDFRVHNPASGTHYRVAIRGSALGCNFCSCPDFAYAAKLAPTLPVGQVLLVNLSGRGDKDMHTVAEKSGIVF